MTRRPSRHLLPCLLAWLLCAALYVWTAEGVAVEHSNRDNVWHHYESLVDGFLAGHSHIARLPMPEL